MDPINEAIDEIEEMQKLNMLTRKMLYIILRSMADKVYIDASEKTTKMALETMRQMRAA